MPEDERAAPAAETTRRLQVDDVQWRRVSPKYLAVAIVGRILSAVVIGAAATFLWLVAEWTWVVWTLPVIGVGFLIAIVIEPRRVRSIGYALRDDDLLFRRGIMFQRFVAVPYGRMQLVDITRGPVSRVLGLADLRLVTAAASSAVSIPGLTEADAEGLRDRLVALAETRRAGL